MRLHKPASIPKACWDQASALCRGIDAEDIPQVALTPALDGLLWTGDNVLRANGFDRFFTR